MAKKKVESQPKVEEEMTEIEVSDEEKKDPDEGLQTIPPSEIEIQETEAEEEEVEEKKVESSQASTDAILQGFNMLRDELRSRGETPPPVPVPQVGESEEVFAKRVNEEIFKDDPYGVLSKAIDRRARKIVETEVAPILGSIMETAFENAEYRLKTDEKDGPVYQKYEKEVKDLLKTLSPAQQKNPQVLKAAFDRVKSLHVDEIIEMEVQRREKKAVVPVKEVRKPVVGEGGSTVLPTSSSKRIMISKKELAGLQRRASQLGVPVEVLVERRDSL